MGPQRGDTVTDDNPLLEAMDVGKVLMDEILKKGVEILEKKETIAIGAGLAAAGIARYMMQHPELIKAAMEQVGEALEITDPSLLDVGVGV